MEITKQEFKTKSLKVTKEMGRILKEIENNLDSSRTGATRVQIKRDKQGKGEMVISFFSDDDLFRLKELIED